MPPFTYAPPTPRFAATIAEMIRGAGDIRAREAESVGQQQAQAAQTSGNAWANAAQNITQAATSIPGQVMQARQQQDAARARAQQTEMQGIQLDAAKRQQSGQRAVAGIMQGDILPAGDVGPRQDSFLDANGLFDVKRITQRLGQLGYGDQSADLVRGAESINDSILKHQEYTAKATQQKTILLGDLADGVSKLTKVGMPFEQAIDFVGAPTLATKQFTPEEFAKTKAQLVSLPPEQQQQALATLMDQAAKLGGQKTLGKDAQEVDRYGRVTATNIVNEPGKGDYTINGQRFKADGTPIGEQIAPLETPAQKTTAAHAEATRLEAERHNREQERISGLSAGRAEASASETARHNRAMEDSARNRVQNRPMLSGDANRIADIDNSIKDVFALRAEVAGNTGAVSKLGAIVPNFVTEYTGIGESAKQRQSQIDRVKQVIGKALEGGVLRKEDEEKYKLILPTIGDPPNVVKSKLDGLESALKRKRETALESLNDAGFNTDASQTRGAPVAPPKSERREIPGHPGAFAVSVDGGKTWKAE